MQTQAQASIWPTRPLHAITRLLIAAALASVVQFSLSSPTHAYVHWWTCPTSTPYMHTNAFGDTYCSAYP